MITDDQYECWLCKKQLVFDGYQRIVVETDTHKEHICNPPTSTTPQPKEVYLTQQNHENRLQREYDEFFEQKKNTDIRKEAVELERYNRRIGYSAKQRLMQSNSNVEKKRVH